MKCRMPKSRSVNANRNLPEVIKRLNALGCDCFPEITEGSVPARIHAPPENASNCNAAVQMPELGDACIILERCATKNITKKRKPSAEDASLGLNFTIIIIESEAVIIAIAAWKNLSVAVKWPNGNKVSGKYPKKKNNALNPSIEVKKIYRPARPR